MLIDLSDHWDNIISLAHKSHNNKRNNNVKSRHGLEKWGGVISDINMLLGEFSVRLYLNLDLDIPIFIGGDMGYDLKYNDIPIEVKYNTRENGHLIFDFVKNPSFVAAVAFLVTATNQEKITRIAGWITRKDFLEKYQENDWGIGKKAWVSQKSLLSTRLFKETYKSKARDIPFYRKQVLLFNQ